MTAEKTITICGCEVRMRYCAATETGFERMSGKAIDVFAPATTIDAATGEKTATKPAATTEDYIMLALSAIVAAYSMTREEAPVTSNDIMYNAAPSEVINLVTAVVELRLKWYDIPAVIEPETADENLPKEKKE